ncbi:MAG: sialidase family protein, partial [Bacteroidota bacterium]|nr:sialidase family protein [Bacteroidota bacterium]
MKAIQAFITRFAIIATILALTSPLSAQYTQIFDSAIPAIRKMLVFDDTLYGCSGSLYGNSGPLVFSTDGGAHWYTYISPIFWLNAEVRDIAREDSLLYILTNQGLFRKSLREKAFTWVTRVTGTEIVPDGTHVHIIVRDPSYPESSVFYHSRNFGRDPRIYEHPGSSPHLILAEDSVLWMHSGHELQFSSDLGRTWQLRMNSSGNPIHSLVRHDGTLIGVPMNGGYFLHRSEDGVSWQEWPLPFWVDQTTTIEVHDNRLCLWGQYIGAYWFDDASVSWTQTASPLAEMQAYFPLASEQFATVNGSLYRHDDVSGQWRLFLPNYRYGSHRVRPITTERTMFLHGEDAPTIRHDAEDDAWRAVQLHWRHELANVVEIDGMLYDAHDTTLWRSSDGGVRWDWFGTLPARAAAMHAAGTRLVMMTAHYPPDTAYVLHSDDRGGTWVREAGFIDDHAMRSFHARDSRRLVAMRHNGTVDRWHYSHDDGRSWRELNPSLPAAIAWVVLAETRLFASTDHGLFVSDDDGVRWMEIHGTPETATLRFAIPGHVCLTTADAFLFIKESDLSFRFLSYPLTFRSFDRVVANNRRLYFLLQHSGEMWMLDLENAVLATPHVPPAIAASSFEVAGVTPSPLRHSGFIHLTATEPVTLTYRLYDIHGRQRLSSPPMSLPQGRHMLPIDRRGLPAGVYL